MAMAGFLFEASCFKNKRAALIERTAPFQWWGEQDLNLRRHEPTDLQSAPFDHFGIPPANFRCRSPAS